MKHILILSLFILISGCNLFQNSKEEIYRDFVPKTKDVVEREPLYKDFNLDTRIDSIITPMTWDTLYLAEQSDILILNQRIDTLLSEIAFQSNQISVLENSNANLSMVIIQHSNLIEELFKLLTLNLETLGLHTMILDALVNPEKEQFHLPYNKLSPYLDTITFDPRVKSL